MAALTSASMHTWHARHHAGGADVIRAAYPVTDPDNPNVVLLKDWQHQIVAVIPATSVLLRSEGELAFTGGSAAQGAAGGVSTYTVTFPGGGGAAGGHAGAGAGGGGSAAGFGTSGAAA